jgi:Secretion system C-terminal sorting domain
MRSFLIFLSFLLLQAHFLKAQTNVEIPTFYLSNVSGKTDDIVLVDLKVKHFKDISSFYFNLIKKDSLLKFVGFETNEAGVKVTSQGTNNLQISFNNGTKRTLTNDASLAKLKFQILASSSTPIRKSILGFEKGEVYADTLISSFIASSGLITINNTTSNSINVSGALTTQGDCNNNLRLKGLVTGLLDSARYVWDYGNSANYTDMLAPQYGGIHFLEFLSLSQGRIGNVLFYLNDAVFYQPNALRYTYTVKSTDCTKSRVVIKPQGGTAPYKIYFDILPPTSDTVFTNVENGVKKINITDAKGCNVSSSIYISNDFYTYSSFDNFDCRDSLGDINLSVIGGLPPYKIRLNGLLVNATINPDSIYQYLLSIKKRKAGIYNIEVTDSNGCKSVQTDTFRAEKFGFYYYYSGSCSKTSLYINVWGGDSATIFTLDGIRIPRNTTLYNIATGQHVLKITTTTGCIETKQFTLSPLSNGLAYNNTYIKTSCKDSTGTLKVYPYWGSFPYKVTVNGLNPSDTSFGTFIFKNVKEGAVSIYVKDGNGCELQRTDVLKDSVIFEAKPIYTGSQCGSAGTLKLSTYGGTRPLKFQLDSGMVQTDSLFKNVLPGAHKALVTDASGCSKSISFFLQTKGLEVSIENVPTLCTDTLVKLKINVVGGQAPFQYIIQGLSQTSNTFSFAEGFCRIVVKDVNGCGDSLMYFVKKPIDSLKISTTLTKAQCLDSLGTLAVKILNSNAAQFVAYELDLRGYGTSLTFNNVKAGYHFLKARTAEGCVSATAFYINDDVLRTVPYIQACFKTDSTYLYAPIIYVAPPYTFSWSNGTTGNRLLVTKPGTYFLTITNSQGCTAITKYDIESCVWAGDTDTSGVVDNKDFLNIGLAYGETGSKRDSSYIWWVGQYSKLWSKQTPALTNFKHIDTNGDGIINASDTTAILFNWSQRHNLTSPKGNGTSPRGVAPSIYVKTDKITEGPNVLPIIFGESNTQALGVYGLAYSIDFDENIIDENSVYVVFNNSWFGNTDKLAMYKVQEGKVHIALTKTNKINLNGAGQIAQLYFKVKAGKLNQNIVFKTENQIAINANAQEVPTQTQTTNTSVTSSINDTFLAQNVQIYPNPASNVLSIEVQNMQLKEVAILDLTGRIIQTYKTENSRFDMPLGQQLAGSYFVKIVSDKGVVVKRFVKM